MDDQNQTAPPEGTRKLKQPKLCFGNDCLEDSAICSADVCFYKEKNALHSEAKVRGVPSEDLRWDYRATTTLYENEDLMRTGLCVKATVVAGEPMEFTLRGSFWEMEQTTVKNIEFFGMAKDEMRIWLLQLLGKDVNIPDSIPNDDVRPFIYAVPIKGLKAVSGPKSFSIGDYGVASGKYDNVFAPILARSKFKTITSVWDEEVPKAFGIVFACDMLGAEGLALTRAKFTADLIGFALRTGISHFESRYEIDPLSWDAEVGRVPVSLHPFIILSEANEAKGWIRSVPLVDRQKEIDIGDCYERLRYFADRFVFAAQAGDIFEQVDKHPLTKRERKLSTGIQRSLRWQAIASDEDDICDSFIATWIALEAILDAVEYPGIFKGDRRTLRSLIEQKIEELSIPDKTDEQLTVSKEMLKGRIFQDQWPIPKKLGLFATAFGVELRPGDLKLVRNLAKVRGAVFHTGNDNPDLNGVQLQQLRYLVERLVVAASVLAYEDTEDDRHQLEFSRIGPEGEAAPLFLNGREVPYEFRIFNGSEKSHAWEVIVEGKIYNEKNADLVYVANDKNERKSGDEEDRGGVAGIGDRREGGLGRGEGSAG